MMTMLCFIVANQTDATSVLDDLRALGVDNSNVNAIANDSVELSELPETDA